MIKIMVTYIVRRKALGAWIVRLEAVDGGYLYLRGGHLNRQVL